MSSSRPHAYLFIIALNSGAEPQLNAMPDLWSKLGLSHSNTISCTATSHQLGKFHIMNHVAPHCTLNNNRLNKVWVLIPNTCTAIQHVSTDIYNSKSRGLVLFHTTKEQIPPVKSSDEYPPCSTAFLRRPNIPEKKTILVS